MCVLKAKVVSLPYIFLVLYVLCFTRSRYQVSVYRTIDPLVSTAITRAILDYMYIIFIKLPLNKLFRAFIG